MAVWLLAGVAARSFYTFTPRGPASAPTWTAPAAYPEYVQAPYTPQYVPYAPQYEQEGWSMSNVLLVMGAGTAGVAAGVALKRPVAALAVSDGDDSKATVAIGAACVAGIVGVYFFHELSTAAILAAVAAYGSTMNNGFGNATRSVGSAANKVYDKTVELNEQYDIVQKAKSATDFTVAAASDLDENYQFTAKIDEKLKLSSAVDKAKDKLSGIRDSLPKNIGKTVD